MARHTFITPALHSAGVTVLHRSPFDDLEVPAYFGPLPRNVAKELVQPFYRSIPDRLDTLSKPLQPIFAALDAPRVSPLLLTFDWRPRICGALFVALRRIVALEDLIGWLLLRSDVCFAAQGYCLALARLNSPRAIAYLQEYLSYYLLRPELRFDQVAAMAALKALDSINHTDRCSSLASRWQTFTAARRPIDLDGVGASFLASLREIDELERRCMNPQAQESAALARLPSEEA